MFGYTIYQQKNMPDSTIQISGISDDGKLPAKGTKGWASTILSPVGKVEIEGEIYAAIALTGYIQAGEKVEVVHFQNNQLFVKKI
jgi:membrane-bound ClpP family serine protease